MKCFPHTYNPVDPAITSLDRGQVREAQEVHEDLRPSHEAPELVPIASSWATTQSEVAVHVPDVAGNSGNCYIHVVGTPASAVEASAALAFAVAAASGGRNSPSTPVYFAVGNAAILDPEALVDLAEDTLGRVLAIPACLVVDTRFLVRTARRCLASGGSREMLGPVIQRCWAWGDKAMAVREARLCWEEA